MRNPFRRRSALAAKSSRTLDEIAEAIDGHGSYAFAGKAVTEETALQVLALYACMRVISEGVASLPFRVYRDEGDEIRVDRDNQLYRLMAQKPNDFQTPFEFIEKLVFCAAFLGHGFAIKNVVGNETRELLPVLPGQVRILQTPDFEISYEVATDQGKLRIPRDKMFHLRGPVLDVSGKISNVVKLARNALGLSIAAEETVAKFYDNGGRPGGILTTPNSLDLESRASLTAAWKKAFGGSKNAGGVAVLDSDMKYDAIMMSGVDAQTMEQRGFEVEEVCRAANVFPQMIMRTDKTATFASAEAFFDAHVRHTLRPWGLRLAQTADRDIGDQTGPLYGHFDTRELTRGSIKDETEHDRAMAELGIMTRNEIRASRGLPPLPGLDDPLTPLNMNQDRQESSDA